MTDKKTPYLDGVLMTRRRLGFPAADEAKAGQAETENGKRSPLLNRWNNSVFSPKRLRP
jgi:hypothetical protein